MTMGMYGKQYLCPSFEGRRVFFATSICLDATDGKRMQGMELKLSWGRLKRHRLMPAL
jgi:hypothetical protein